MEIFPGTDGLLHVSEIADYRVRDVRDELTEGQQLLVKVINVEPNGKIRLSRKAVLQDEAAASGEPMPGPREGSDTEEGDEDNVGNRGDERRRDDRPRGPRPGGGGNRRPPRGPRR